MIPILAAFPKAKRLKSDSFPSPVIADLCYHQLLAETAGALTDKEIADISKSLLAIAEWINTSQSAVGAGKKVEKAISVIVRYVPYIPWDKPVFRAMKIDIMPKGDTCILNLGKQNIKSWTTSPEKAQAFLKYLGNLRNRIIVELKSPGEEIFNTRWLRRTLVSLSRMSPKLKKPCAEVNKTIRKPNAWDDEDEVLMKLSPKIRVQVIKRYPKYDPRN